MKRLSVAELLRAGARDQHAQLFGWVKAKRDHGGILFLDIVDSTGVIQAVLASGTLPAEHFAIARETPPESSVCLKGFACDDEDSATQHRTFTCTEFRPIGLATLQLSPRPRSDFDTFSASYANLVLEKRHLFLRNDRLMAVMRFRHKLVGEIHKWFRSHEFVEIHAPILSPISLYEEQTAFHVDFFGTELLLNQCVAFYLESLVHCFEKVYNLGPSFRAEESKGRRHLAEYWHVKAELAFCDAEEIMALAEKLIAQLCAFSIHECRDEMETLGAALDAERLTSLPYPRMTYEDAIRFLNAHGIPFGWGGNLGADEVELLSRPYVTPFWVVGMPRSTQPFPYAVDEADRRLTKTADLIAPGGFGELLGTAEKIHSATELRERLAEKGLADDPRYRWYAELREYGSVPHAGFGMGLERVIRWLLKVPHVRDTIPFPRLFQRSPYP